MLDEVKEGTVMEEEISRVGADFENLSGPRLLPTMARLDN